MRRGSRTGLAFLLVGVLLAGLVIGADRLALAITTNRVSAELKRELGTPVAPTVDIEGFPFLTQVIARRLEAVHVVADDVTPAAQPEVSLGHVDLRLHNVTSPDLFKTFNAAQVDGTATLDYATLQKLVNLPVAYSREDRIEISVQTTIVTVPVTARIVGRPDLNVADQTFTLADPELTVAGVDVPDSTSRALLNTLVKPVPITGLPFGLTVGGITAQPTGLDVVVAGQNVTFSR